MLGHDEIFPEEAQDHAAEAGDEGIGQRPRQRADLVEELVKVRRRHEHFMRLIEGLVGPAQSRTRPCQSLWAAESPP